MKKIVASIIIISVCTLLLSSCATSPYTYERARSGGAIGAIAGALIDKNNRWRGAVLGGAFGGITTEISARATREAALSRKAKGYRSIDGW